MTEQVVDSQVVSDEAQAAPISEGEGLHLEPAQVRAVNVLLSGCQVAQRRGAFSLSEAHTLQEAIDSLVPREEQERQRQEAQAASAEQAGGEDSDVGSD